MRKAMLILAIVGILLLMLVGVAGIGLLIVGEAPGLIIILAGAAVGMGNYAGFGMIADAVAEIYNGSR